MRTWTEDRWRPHFIMDKKMADATEQRHQVPQFNKRLRRSIGHGTTSRVVGPRRNPENFGLERRMRKKFTQMVSAQVSTVEGIMTFAERPTTNEVVVRCVSASLFVKVNEWQYKDILDDIDKLSWEEMSEDCTPTCRKGAPARLFNDRLLS